MDDRQTIFLLYHFFHPDDVISARLYTEMAEDLAAAGHHLIALPSNRSCHHLEVRLASNQDWNGICIRRVWRPAFSQATVAGRLLNSFFMLFGWTCWAIFRGRPKTTKTRASQQTVIIGTDPVFGILASHPMAIVSSQYSNRALVS